MTSNHRCHLYLLPSLILSLLIVSYYVYVVSFCIFVVQNELESIIYISFFNVLFILLSWSFLSILITPVSRVPSTYKLTDEEIELLDRTDDINKNLVMRRIIAAKNLVVQTRDASNLIRYCYKCKQIKPDRARHCSRCDTCILKMDHHCPWLNNCIGYSNYKHFNLFLFYSSLYSIYFVCTSGPYFEAIFREIRIHFVVVGYFVLFYGLISVTMLVYHCKLLCTNETSIDALAQLLIVIENATFNLGCRRNFQEVFGKNVALWPFPIFSSLGTGCNFPIRMVNPNCSNV